MSSADFAVLAAVAESKASMSDLEAVVQRQVQRRLAAATAHWRVPERIEKII